MAEFFTNGNIVFYLIAYLLGGVPFGLLLAKFFADVNITESGSGSIGATNVLRVVKEKNPQLAKKLGIITVTLDALKGVVVILAAMMMGFDESVLWTIGVLSVIGHCFSPYLWFEGGKGVATGLGVLVALTPLSAVAGILVWLIVGKTLKISSVSSLTGLIGAVISSFFIYPDLNGLETHTPIILLGFFIFYKHIPNIVRLVKGQEKAVV
ncbi:MAG: glycerol-3-phosphate 1-O-acyltransferase PlsY [Campylobacterales bacterium]|nr:glycerol-3-phosphate 1-O-acyltransferase PlsY [Campylobacterales bacterium]